MRNKHAPNIAIIGRGESVLRSDGGPAKQESTDVGVTERTDEEVPVEVDSEKEEAAEDNSHQLLEESAGWIFPQIKLSTWDPENEKQWNSFGKGIARRNLIASIPNLTCAFGVWMVWSGKCRCTK